jgi:hypothetical protein
MSIDKEDKKYSVFGKAFHIPSEWENKDDIKFLTEHQYATTDTQKTLKEINTRLKRMGYAEDNDAMVHDYLHYMIKDLLDKNHEVYITENDIKSNNLILNFLLNTTPDFIIKSNSEKARKTLIVDIYVGGKKDESIKSKYRKLAMFADFIIINKHDFSDILLNNKILPLDDVNYLYKQYQIFLTEYYYWKSCNKLQKVIFNDIENIEIHDFEKYDNTGNKVNFIIALEKRAAIFANKDDI